MAGRNTSLYIGLRCGPFEALCYLCGSLSDVVRRFSLRVSVIPYCCVQAISDMFRLRASLDQMILRLAIPIHGICEQSSRLPSMESSSVMGGKSITAGRIMRKRSDQSKDNINVLLQGLRAVSFRDLTSLLAKSSEDSLSSLQFLLQDPNTTSRIYVLSVFVTETLAQTNRKHEDNSYFNPPSMESRQASSHRSLGAEFYERSPPPPPPKKTKKDESETTGI
ncbi:unnamed protein product [Arabis nemorensis]|uniref:Uncharacterized protein n=1 Tax=Arabis nemorensis TaxID=586526 RepID=A0A565CUU0_9BRAS|nr:unnamed protein product [Arabis nemorensis]